MAIWLSEFERLFFAAGLACPADPGERLRSKMDSMRGWEDSGEAEASTVDGGGERVASEPRSNEVEVEAMGLAYGALEVLQSCVRVSGSLCRSEKGRTWLERGWRARRRGRALRGSKGSAGGRCTR